MIETLLTNFILILIGCVCGWVARSLKFGIDRDCANPDHEKHEP